MSLSVPDLNTEDDPRTGSARGDANSTGTTSTLGNKGESASLAATLSTLAPVLVYTAVCIILFWVLRRILTRVYSPRATLRHYFAQERSESPLKGWFDWVKPFIKEDDVHVLNRSSLDAYLFLRYLKILSFICFVGCCIMWPILMPIHATGGGGLAELDRITMGNVTNPKLLFVHVAVAWVFFGFILFTIYRECIYYINLRHAYLFSPYYSKRLSSRTVLFQCVPHRYLDAQRLRKVYGDSVKHVWILRDTSDLEDLVDEREETARRLERCEIRLIKLADAARRKGQRSAPSQPLHSLPLRRNGELPKETPIVTTDATQPMPTTRGASTDSTGASTSTSSVSIASATPVTSPSAAPTDDPEKHIGLDSPPPDVNGSIAAQWVPASHRPGHRPLGNFFRRVDTIKWTRNRLKLLAPQIAKLRRKLHAGDEGRLLGSVFIEFQTQSDAQRAYQTLAHDRPMHMSPRFIGIRPDEVVWHSLRLTWFERMVRRVAMMALIVATTVFWAIPSAFVGLLTNVSYLTKTFFFLEWLNLLPKVIIGVIQGFVPALALSLLMAIVPWLMRGCARLAGEPSLGEIELYVQSFYFGFQVVQVFLITTLTSAASAAIQDVLKEPFSAPKLLSQNLPKASNFYLSYILIQCLAVGATGLLHLWDVLKHGVMTRFIQSPRVKWRIHNFRRPIHWGGWFPIFTNLGVIAICYACIAPLILGFASLGLYIIYILNKYNFIFVEDSSIDTKGLVYPRALKQLLFGLYIAEICLVGLFALQSAFAPMLLMVIFLVLTVIFHVMLSEALSPLLANLPRTLALEHEELMGMHKDEDTHLPAFDIDPATIPLPPDADEEDSDDDGPVHETTGSRGGLSRSLGVEGSPSLSKIVRKWSWALYVRQVTSFLERIGLGPVLQRVDAVIHPTYTPTPNALMRFLHPNTFDSFVHLRQLIPEDLPDPTETYPEDYIFRAYYPPEMWTPPPKLWLPRDEGGVSAQEVEHCRRFGRTVASDEGAWLDENGRIRCDVQEAPFWEDRALY